MAFKVTDITVGTPNQFKIICRMEHRLICRTTIGECHSLSYDALTAHVAIVFTRYMLLAMEQRQNEDQRTLGELFFFLVDEWQTLLSADHSAS